MGEAFFYFTHIVYLFNRLKLLIPINLNPNMMKQFFIVTGITALILSVWTFSSATAQNDSQSQQAVLLFTKTEGFRHQSIPAGIKAIQILADQNNIRAKHTEDAEYFHPDSLSGFDGVVFLNTTGDILNNPQQLALKQFIRSGGGFMGIHAAADTEYGWPWYGKMVGAYFESHPRVQEATILVKDYSHPATSFLESQWIRTDEWYNYKQISDHIQVLMELDESSYEGGANGRHHPIAWYHNFEGGRIFYTGLGHTVEGYSEPDFLKHLTGGLLFILEDKE